MRVAIELSEPKTEDNFGQVKLSIPDGGAPCYLSAEASKLRSLGGIPPEPVLDLLLLAQVVYALDRRIPRRLAHDSWTRSLSLTLPVSEVDQWRAIKESVDDCLSFLTGDIWDIGYEARTTQLMEPLLKFVTSDPREVSAVSLFSGGLDSLVGAIDQLEVSASKSVLLVGHHDPRIAGPLSDQKGVRKYLQRYYQARTPSVFVTAGADSGKDTTLRSRSFLFIALGIYAANTVSRDTPLLIPENGAIALNVPLTPSRIGSCSTCTVHPHFLSQIETILAGLGIHSPLSNPLATKTKGECIAECLNREVLAEAAPTTTSCAKRGHTKTWLRRDVKQCGRCIPYIYRRAALHAVGLDLEVYGRDICTGEVNVESDYEYAADFRACVSFLRRNPSDGEIASLLFANGKLEVARLSEYADVVARAMNEVRDLIRDKGTDEVKRWTGLPI